MGVLKEQILSFLGDDACMRCPRVVTEQEEHLGMGRGDDYRFSDCSGYGCGYAWGSGGEHGGHGNAHGAVKSINGKEVYYVDGMPTIIESLHGNYGKGFTVGGDMHLRPCYIVKEQGYFAHGKTLAEAVAFAERKYNYHKPIEERIQEFKQLYPTLDTVADSIELFSWHHILTGSCRLGREEFLKSKGIEWTNGQITIKDFFDIAKDAYGKAVIRRLMQDYDYNVE